MFFFHSLCTYVKNKTYIYFTMDLFSFHDKNITGKIDLLARTFDRVATAGLKLSTIISINLSKLHEKSRRFVQATE